MSHGAWGESSRWGVGCQPDEKAHSCSHETAVSSHMCGPAFTNHGGRSGPLDLLLDAMHGRPWVGYYSSPRRRGQQGAWSSV